VRIRRPVAITVLVALLALLAPATALAADGGAAPGVGEKEPKEPPGPPPQLMLFHGGSFLFEDPFFQPTTAQRAIDAGFVPHYVHYPLYNMPAAVLRARAEASRLREKFGAGRVYAYGASAGGTLAAELSGDGLVAAAVAKAPVSDLVGWEWPLGAYGANYFEQVSLSEAARYRLSPDRRQQKSPLLIYQGRADQVVPPAMNESFAAKYPRVYLWLVPGGHTTERARPYLIGKAMHWLARTAARQARAAAKSEALP
jgi:pimeloyl-ACP methyl ester carboxylesterase